MKGRWKYLKDVNEALIVMKWTKVGLLKNAFDVCYFFKWLPSIKEYIWYTVIMVWTLMSITIMNSSISYF